MRHRTLILIVGAFAVVVAACSAGASSDTEIRPFTEVQASEVSFENDPTFTGGHPANPEFNDASFAGQVLRFGVATSTGGNTGAIEIRAFAPGSM